jgi:hypothetical protein
MTIQTPSPNLPLTSADAAGTFSAVPHTALPLPSSFQLQPMPVKSSPLSPLSSFLSPLSSQFKPPAPILIQPTIPPFFGLPLDGAIFPPPPSFQPIQAQINPFLFTQYSRASFPFLEEGELPMGFHSAPPNRQTDTARKSVRKRSSIADSVPSRTHDSKTLWKGVGMF